MQTLTAAYAALLLTLGSLTAIVSVPSAPAGAFAAAAVPVLA